MCTHSIVTAIESTHGDESRLSCYYCGLGFVILTNRVPPHQSERRDLLIAYENELNKKRAAEMAKRDIEQASAILRRTLENQKAVRQAFRLGQ